MLTIFLAFLKILKLKQIPYALLRHKSKLEKNNLAAKLYETIITTKKKSLMFSFKKISLFSLMLSLMPSACCGSKNTANNNNNAVNSTKKTQLKIILGSTRKGRTSDKIGNALKQIADKRSDLNTEILDLNEFNLPFLNDETPPASRKTITDPVVKKWADKIAQADAFIIVVPEYNSGYPGVLKNALDSLYQEWNNKPVAFVGFSGGPSGGANAIAQLHEVALALQMKPIEIVIKVPTAWKAFDEKRNLVHPSIASDLNRMIDQLKKS